MGPIKAKSLEPASSQALNQNKIDRQMVKIQRVRLQASSQTAIVYGMDVFRRSLRVQIPPMNFFIVKKPKLLFQSNTFKATPQSKAPFQPFLARQILIAPSGGGHICVNPGGLGRDP